MGGAGSYSNHLLVGGVGYRPPSSFISKAKFSSRIQKLEIVHSCYLNCLPYSERSNNRIGADGVEISVMMQKQSLPLNKTVIPKPTSLLRLSVSNRA